MIREETQKLEKTSFIKEIMYLKWLNYFVIVRLKNVKWWMCTNNINMNNKCSKYLFPLYNIGWWVYETSRCQTLNFISYDLGYNQIMMNLINDPKNVYMIDDLTFIVKLCILDWRTLGSSIRDWRVVYLSSRLGITSKFTWRTWSSKLEVMSQAMRI